jgi:tetratricopeptide (TPR) repeat protein
MNNLQWTRYMIALPVFVLLVWITARACRIGIADFTSLEARFLVDQSYRDRKPLAIQAWLHAEEQLDTSRSWDGDNPVYDEYLANLYFMRAVGYMPNSREQQAFYETALEHYLRAAYLRPTSGYTHASIATVKFRLGQFDRDFSLALARASKYGPWERPVQEQVIDAGLRTWGGLAEGVREEVRATLWRAYQMNQKGTQEFLAARKSILPGCAQLRLAIPEICPPR